MTLPFSELCELSHNMCGMPQVAVMILSLGFIAFVTVLHIVGKVRVNVRIT